MSEFVKVGRVSDFPEGCGRMVQVAGKRVAVFNVGGRFLALQDDCPHMGASLADGRIEDGGVVCHMHDWIFDLETGRGRPPAKSWACARVHVVKVEDGAVLVRKPEPDPDPPKDDWPVWDDDMLR